MCRRVISQGPWHLMELNQHQVVRFGAVERSYCRVEVRFGQRAVVVGSNLGCWNDEFRHMRNDDFEAIRLIFGTGFYRESFNSPPMDFSWLVLIGGFFWDFIGWEVWRWRSTALGLFRGWRDRLSSHQWGQAARLSRLCGRMKILGL